jgi:hypothetical protein
MTSNEEQHVKDILRFFYPDETPPAVISQEVGDLAAEMLNEALIGSKAMDFVPRPAGFKPGLAWLVSQAVQMAWRSSGKQRIYEAVRRTVALKYKSRYAMAKAGIRALATRSGFILGSRMFTSTQVRLVRLPAHSGERVGRCAPLIAEALAVSGL